MTELPLSDQLARWTASLGALARPFVLYSAAGSAAFSTISIPLMKMDLIAGAAFIGAAWTGVAALYGAKALEERGKAKSSAEVAIAASANAPATAPAPTPDPAEAALDQTSAR